MIYKPILKSIRPKLAIISLTILQKITKMVGHRSESRRTPNAGLMQGQRRSNAGLALVWRQSYAGYAPV